MLEVAIAVENLSKRYFIKQTVAGEGRSRYTALRDVIGHELLCMARKGIAYRPSPECAERRSNRRILGA